MSSSTLARSISIAGHPLVLIPLTVAAATRSGLWTLVIAAGTVLPLMAIIIRNVRRGTWSNMDVSRQEQRAGLYRAALPLLVISATACYALGASPRLMRSLAAAAAMLAAGLAGTRLLKVSMHMMFAAFCGVAVVRLHPWSAVAIVPFVIAIAWSRRTLDRHTPAEIAAGLLIGLGAGIYGTA